jgi:hypothetical protein
MSTAAAVAAYWLKSERPLTRARELAPQFEMEGPARSDFGIRLLYFQLMVMKSLPADPRDRVSVGDALQEWRAASGETAHGGEATVALDSLATALKIQDYDATAEAMIDPKSSLAWFVSLAEANGLSLDRPLYRDRVNRWMLGDVRGDTRDVLASAVLELMQPRSDIERPALSRLVEVITLPDELKDLLSLPVQQQLRVLPAKTLDRLLQHETAGVPVPLGFWFEPLMAAATALVKGANAIQDVLTWVALSRLSYGYAWRVLIDWSSLESVKGHPAFLEFLRREDEDVKQVESAIDRGEYAL